MAATRLLTTLTLLVLVLVTKQAASIECYNCIFPGQENCADPFNSTGILHSPCELGRCYKVKAEARGSVAIFRGCGDPGSVNVGAQASTTTCTTDYCNGSSHPSLNGVLIFILSSIMAIMIST